jgi:energy-coupling factor transporter ATP-binding protein EcfA2
MSIIDENTAGSAAIENLLQHFDPATRTRIEIMELVKARVLLTERDDEVAEHFSDLLCDLAMRLNPDEPIGPGNRREAHSLVLVGKTGAGKTTLLNRLFSTHPAFPGYNKPGSGCSLVTVSVPSPCNLKALGLGILVRLGYPMRGNASIPMIWQRVTDRLAHLGILVLHLDEVHNVLQTANSKELTDLRKTFKALMVDQRWPVALVVSGLPEVTSFFETLEDDDEVGSLSNLDTKGEVRRRVRFMELTSLCLPDDCEMIADAMSDLASIATMTTPVDFRTSLVPRLIHVGLYELGTCMELIHEGIDKALKDKSPMLATKHFAQAFKARTGCADAANPFLAADWLALDCRRVLQKNREEADERATTGLGGKNGQKEHQK